MVKNPSWQEADQLAIYKQGLRSWTWGYWETTPAGGPLMAFLKANLCNESKKQFDMAFH